MASENEPEKQQDLRKSIANEGIVPVWVPRDPRVKSTFRKPTIKCKTEDRLAPDFDPNPYIPPKRHITFIYDRIKRIQRPNNISSDEPRTVVEHVHDEFFKVVDGRPVRPNHAIEMFKTNVRNILLFRANAAYLKDQVLQIDTLMAFDEVGTYNKICRLYQDTVMNYQLFLKDSYLDAQVSMERAKESGHKIAMKEAELEEISFQYTKLKYHVIYMSDRLELLGKYRDFMIKISPIWWRVNNKIALTGRSVKFKKIFEEETDADHFSRGVILLKDMKCMNYFTHPNQVMKMFDDYCSQSFNYMRIHNIHTNVISPIFKRTGVLKNILQKDLDDVVDFIKLYQNRIDYLETKEKEYQSKFYKLLNNQLKEQVSSHDYLKLHLCLQDITFRIVGNEVEPNDTITVLMKQIELKYEKLLLGLDYLDLTVVKTTTTDSLKKDREIMTKAYRAQRELKEWAVFDKKLRSSFEPPRFRKS